MVKKVGNLIPNTFFMAKGSGDSDLEKHVRITWHCSMRELPILTS